MGTINRLAGMLRGGGRTTAPTTRRSRTTTTTTPGTAGTARGVGGLLRRLMR